MANAANSPDRPGIPLQSGATPRLYEKALGILSGRIASGALKPGTLLRETGIAQQFGISRAPARQALIELERLGLVEKADGRGFRVSEAPPREVDLPRLDGVGGEDGRLAAMASWERIYGEVESEVTARTSFAGWRINEAVLARHYSVSRTVARDVMGRLQQRGVVRKDERARWIAPALTPNHVGELYELRWVLEPLALRKAAPNLPPGLVAELRSNLEMAIANAHAIGGETLDRLEQDLHVRLLGHCGNRTLMQALALHQSLLIAHRFLYRWTLKLFDTEPFLPEHLDVVERLEEGRVAAAAEALERHLKVSRERAIARIAAVSESFTPEDLPWLKRFD